MRGTKQSIYENRLLCRLKKAPPTKIEAEDTLDMIQKALGGDVAADKKLAPKKKTVAKKKVVKKKEPVDQT